MRSASLPLPGILLLSAVSLTMFGSASAPASQAPKDASASEPNSSAEAAPESAKPRATARKTRRLIGKRRQGLRPQLDANAKLARAARGHSRRMARTGCFSHRCQGEPELGRRIRRTGYLNGSSSYAYGEVIAYSSGARATPRATVRGWMRSRGHRRLLMSRSFREIGVGVARSGDRRYFTAVLGRR